MKVSEVKKKIAAEKEAAKLARVEAFVRQKLARLDAISLNLESLYRERRGIEESLRKVELNDYSDVPQNVPSPSLTCSYVNDMLGQDNNTIWR